MTLKVVGSNPIIYPKMLFQTKNCKNLININVVKKSHNHNLSFFYNLDFKTNLLFKPMFIYYNFFSLNVKKSNTVERNNFIFLFNKKKWHYSFNLLQHNKTLFFFSVGVVLNFLKILSKSLRRSKKGFSIYLNMVLNILKKFLSYNTTILLNFFDNKLVFFKKRLNNYRFNNMLFIKLPTNVYKKFKRHKSIKRRLTKKFIKRI